MEKVENINIGRIVWCCEEASITLQELSKHTNISLDTLSKVIDFKKNLTINQLQNIASYFNRGLLFFLEDNPANEEKIYTLQFRTITNQKPELTNKLRVLIEKIEGQREVYLSLKENLNDYIEFNWYPEALINYNDIKKTASNIRNWLNLDDKNNFAKLRTAIENKGIMVFKSNGYKGMWQIDKESPIRGFSLYYETLPIIAIKKQMSEKPEAFTLMHELAHLLLHKESIIDDDDDFYSYRDKEKEANEFAGNILIPDEFLARIDLNNFPINNVELCEENLKNYSKEWCVSTEVILRRLLDENYIPRQYYTKYREWKKTQPIPESKDGGSREYRFREPINIFGKKFVNTVLDALQANQITLSKASSFLDNIKIKDIHKLEAI